jgi:hypothetical protein
MTLSAAFEELAGAAAGTATEARTRAEVAEAGFEEAKRIEVHILLPNSSSTLYSIETESHAQTCCTTDEST